MMEHTRSQGLRRAHLATSRARSRWHILAALVVLLDVGCGASNSNSPGSDVGGTPQAGDSAIGGSAGQSTQVSKGGSQQGGSKASGGTTGRPTSGGSSSKGGQTGASNNDFRIIGYEESWTGDNLDRIQFDKLTHVNYAFGLPNTDGSLQAVPNEPKLDALVTRAHAAGVTVSLSIGGWNNADDSAITAVAASSSARTKFASAVFDYVNAHDLDGADIDWEYPEAANASNFTALMAALSSRLRPAGKLLTIAAGGGSFIAAGITAPSYEYLDYIMVMSYDDNGSANHSSYAYAESGLNLFLNDKAVPPSKLVLGVPFYSHPSYKSYSAIVAQNPAAAQLDESGGENYNGIPTIRAKTQLAMDRASGIMIWELSQDTKDSLSLLNAIYSTAHP